MLWLGGQPCQLAQKVKKADRTARSSPFSTFCVQATARARSLPVVADDDRHARILASRDTVPASELGIGVER